MYDLCQFGYVCFDVCAEVGDGADVCDEVSDGVVALLCPSAELASEGMVRQGVQQRLACLAGTKVCA